VFDGTEIEYIGSNIMQLGQARNFGELIKQTKIKSKEQ
jgi:hypothetical protein